MKTNLKSAVSLPKRSTFALWFIPVVGLAGCTVGPNYESPRVTVLGEFGEQGREPTTQSTAATRPSRTRSGVPPVVAWWTSFRDPQLDALVTRAMDGNLDLRRAAARVREARARRGTIAADAFPEVNTAASYEHTRASSNGVASAFGGGNGGGTNVGGGGANAPGAGGGAAIPGGALGEFDLYQVGFDASWELDLFGGTRRAIEAADASVQGAVEDRRDALVTLLAEVARDYCELRATQRRLEIARENLLVQQRTLGLIDELVRQGVNNELDLSRARAQVLTTQAAIPPLEAQAGESIHRLGVLVGERPTALAAELSVAGPVPPVPDEVPVGLPSGLLRRRPDIRGAERQLAASSASVGVAVADLLPKFALNGSIGLQSTEPGHLVDMASRYFSVGPSVSWPLFDAGRNRARVRVAEAQRDQAVLAFRQIVLNAFRDVEDALIRYDKMQERTRTLRLAVEQNRRALNISQDLYKQGLIDFLSVLDAERSLFASQDALAISEGELSTTLVALYKSLGGGWEIELQQDQYGPTARPVVARGAQAGDPPDLPAGLTVTSTFR